MDIAVNRAVTMLAGVVFLVWGSAAQAQSLSDPTQPPAALAGPGGDATPSPTVPQLQSILVSREAGGRRVAVINGEMVRQGTKIGDAVVARVGENEVVLRRGRRLETLKLFPHAAAPAGQPLCDSNKKKICEN
jgi:hypothetical protein